MNMQSAYASAAQFYQGKDKADGALVALAHFIYRDIQKARGRETFEPKAEQ